MKHCPSCGKTYPDGQRFCLDDGALLSLRDPYYLVGRTLAAKYRLDALVGVGGMGAVYSAYHLALDRRVAFKILQPNLTLGDTKTIDLFEREAKMAGRLVHENIVMVLDAGRTADEVAYIAMEWLDGRTLESELAASGPFSLARAAEILRQTAAALEAAHAERIIHRDLKPANIMLIAQAEGRERVKVLDFGIGKVLSETAGSPVSSVMGTPHYASPEQFQLHGRIDARTDIYSLGVVFFQMLTGSLPFEATSVHELIRMHMTVTPPPLRTLRPDAPAEIERLVAFMLAKDPEDRPPRVSEIPLLLDKALAAAKSQPRGQSEQDLPQAVRNPDPLSFELTERLPPEETPTTFFQPSSQPTELSAAPETAKFSPVDNSGHADTPSPPPPRPIQSQTASSWNSNRMIFVGVGSVLILIAGLSAVMWQSMSRESDAASVDSRIAVEPSLNPAQTTAVNEQSGPKDIASTTPPADVPKQSGVNGRWVINNDETVLDTRTGLMWMRKDFRVIEDRFVNGWQEAMGWAKKMNDRRYAGYGDWRVPSISEYKSIRDKSAYSSVFERQGEDCYWSRNEVGKWTASYIYMSGEFGGAAVSGDKNEGTNKPGVLFNGKFSVRLVRQAN